MSNEAEQPEEEPSIRALRRQAFKKREQIMRKALRQSFDKLALITDKTPEIMEIGNIIASALNEEEAVEIPSGKDSAEQT